jgi:hypothetical protein
VPLAAGAREPNESLQVPGFVVEYRNQPIAIARFGIPEPFSCAAVLEMLVAATVVVVGGVGVVNVTTLPNVVPTEFIANAHT